jgi:hypothetical protein
MSGMEASCLALLELLPRTGRGPKREGIFALWLVVRVAQDLIETPPAERPHKRRLAALEQRLSSLTVPPPLRRALAGALAQLRDGSPAAAAQVLAQLAAPARDAAGPDAAAAIDGAARAARLALAPSQRQGV